MEKFTRNNRWRREGIIVERGQKWGSRHSAAFNLKLLKTSFKHGCRFTSTNDKPFLSFDFIYILFLLLLFHFFFFYYSNLSGFKRVEFPCKLDKGDKER